MIYHLLTTSKKRLRRLSRLFVIVIGGLLLPGIICAEEADETWNIRHLYVPVDSLAEIAADDRFAAILSKQEFTKLVEQARQSEEANELQRQPAIFSSANYVARIDGERLIAEATLQMTTFAPNWNSLNIRISNWNVEAVTLNDTPAIAKRESPDLLQLLVEGAGQQTVNLKLSMPLIALGSDKVATFGLTGAPAGEFVMTLPPKKHLSVNGNSLSRDAQLEEPAEYTVPVGGKSQLEIKITDRQESSRADVLTFANTAYGISVMPSEITWIANTQLQVYGKSIDRLTCKIPNSLEITAVESTGLESWELSDDQDEPGLTSITLQYRQSFTGNRTITFRGILSSTPEEPWDVPNLSLPELTSHVGMILIEHPENLRLQTTIAKGVRAITAEEAQSLTKKSASLQYQIWEEDFALQFVADLKEQQVQAAMTNVLDINSLGLDLYTTLNLQSRLAPLFDARLRFPTDWHVTEVLIDGQPSTWEIVPEEAGINELRIVLNPPLSPGENRGISIVARSQPEQWPVEATPVRVSIPEIKIPQAAMVEALYGISADDDLDIIGVEISGLDPARQTDVDLLNRKLQNLGKKIRLGYTYQDSVFSGQLEVSRKPATLSAETLTFFRIDEETVFMRLEATIDVTGGGLREIEVVISESAGEKLRFDLTPWGKANLPVKVVEQTATAPIDGNRTWTLKLDQYITGSYLLATESRVPRVQNKDGDEAATAPEEYSPAQMTIPASIVQSGYIAIEGSPDEHVDYTATSVDGSVLSTVDPVDFPQGQYRPQQRMVAGFRYVHPGWSVKISNHQFEKGAIPSAIGHSANLQSVIGEAGEVQHEVIIHFTTYGAQSLIVSLPEGSELWSTLLDEEPTEVRQLPQGVQVPLSTAQANQGRYLKLLYSSKAPKMNRLGELKAVPPQVFVLDGTGQQQPLEILKHEWQLHYPEQTLLVDSSGRFEPTEQLTNNSLLNRLWNSIRLPTAGALWNRFIVLVVASGVIYLLIQLAKRAQGTRSSFKRFAGVFAVLAVVLILFTLLLPTVQHSRDVSRLHTASDVQYDLVEKPFGAPEESEPESPVIDLQDVEESVESPLAESKPVESPINQDKLKRQRRGGSLSEEMDDPNVLDAFRKSSDPNPFVPQAPAITIWDKSQSGLINQNADGAANGVNQSLAQPNSPRYEGMLGSDNFFYDSLADFKPRSGIGGLLSMTFDLQIPQNTRTQTFFYSGNETQEDAVSLHVHFADRTAGRVLLVATALGIALLGWWFRAASTSWKLLLVFLTVVVPLALAGVAPPVWQILLEGTLFGGVAMLSGWCLRSVVDCCQNCCSTMKKKFQMPPTTMVMLAICLSASSLVMAAEPIQPNQQAEQIQQTAPQELTPRYQATTVVPPQPAPPAPYVVIPYPPSDRVWIPHATFNKLWQATHSADLPQEPAPVEALVAQADYLASVETIDSELQASIQARWVVLNPDETTSEVILPIRHAALQNVTIDGEQASLSANRDGQTLIVVTGKGPHIVDAKISLRATGKENAGQFETTLMPVSSGMFNLQLPKTQQDLQVRVNGSTGMFRRTTDEQKTLIEIPIDQGGKLVISWRPKQQGGLENLVLLESSVAAVFDDIGMHINTSYVTKVRQGAINDISFQLPDDVSIRQIVGEDVGGWEIDNESKTLRLYFRRQIEAETRFQIDLFQKKVNQQTNLSIKTLASQEINREVGQLAIYAAAHLQVRPSALTGLSQIDLKQFQPQHTLTRPKSAPLFAYRYTQSPVSLNANLIHRESKSNAQLQHGVHISQRKILIASLIDINLTGSPQKTIDVRLPIDYLTIDVQCEHASDWYLTNTEEDGPTLTVELDQPRLGTIQISLEGHLVKEPDQAVVDFFLPELFEVTNHNTLTGIWLDDAYEGVVSSMDGWKSTPVNQLPSQLKQLQKRPAQFAFRSIDQLPDIIEIELTRAVTELNADAVTLIAVSDATIDYGITFRWNISQAATDLFTFTIPDWLGQLDITGPGIRQVSSEALAGGLRRWTISLVDPVRNQYLITAAATVPAPIDLQILTPEVTFEQVDETGAMTPLATQRQYAILVNLSDDQLVPVDLNEFESVSVDQLPLKVNQALVQQAMEITRVRADKLPQWELQQMEHLSTAQAVVVAVNLQTVLEQDGSWRTKANYAIRNRGRQFLALSLPENARVLSVFVRGQASRSVLSTINEQPVHLIALPQTSVTDLSFDVNLILAGRLSNHLLNDASISSQTVKLPAPQVVSQKESTAFGLPVAQTLWTVHAPNNLDIAPTGDVKGTNLTMHNESDQFATELQSLQRYKADIIEMQRMYRDKSVSAISRKKVSDNLKQLGKALEQQVEAVRKSKGGELSGEKQNEWFSNNRFLFERTQTKDTDFDLIEQEIEQQVPVQQRGRAYILNSNNDIIMSNTASGVELGIELEQAPENLNFSRASIVPAKKSKAEGKEAIDRMQLKGQLANQAPIMQSQSDRYGNTLTEGASVNQAPAADLRSHTIRNTPAAQQQIDDLLIDGKAGRGSILQDEAEIAGDWSAVGGLSVEMDLPVHGQELAFSKVGGNPVLTLSIRPKQTWTLGIGAVWCVACLLTGGIILSRLSTQFSLSVLFDSLSLIALIVGIVGFVLLPADFRWAFFVLFCLGGLIRIVLAGLSSEKTVAV